MCVRGDTGRHGQIGGKGVKGNSNKPIQGRCVPTPAGFFRGPKWYCRVFFSRIIGWLVLHLSRRFSLLLTFCVSVAIPRRPFGRAERRKGKERKGKRGGRLGPRERRTSKLLRVCVREREKRANNGQGTIELEWQRIRVEREREREREVCRCRRLCPHFPGGGDLLWGWGEKRAKFCFFQIATDALYTRTHAGGFNLSP